MGFEKQKKLIYTARKISAGAGITLEELGEFYAQAIHEDWDPATPIQFHGTGVGGNHEAAKIEIRASEKDEK